MAILFYANSEPEFWDFTDWTESDGLDHWSIDGTTVNFNGVTRLEGSGVHKDFGAGYFSGDFEFQAKVNIDSGALTGFVMFFGFAMDPNNYSLQKKLADNDGFSIIAEKVSGANFKWRLFQCYSDTDDETAAFAYPAEHWLTLTRNGSTATLNIYDDSSRTSLVDTLSLSLPSVENYRYLTIAGSRESGTASHTLTGSISEVVQIN